MSFKLSVPLLLIVSLVGCGSNGDNDDDDGDDVMTGDDAPPFTNGASTLSGAADAGLVDGPRGTARFSNPVNVAFSDGVVFVADFDNNKVRAVDATTGETTTVVSQPGFARPFGLAIAPDGTLFVSTDNDPNGGHTDMTGTIWRVNVDAKTATVVAASIGRPRGIAVLPDGRIAVADQVHHVVEVVSPANGTVTTVAGTWNAVGMVDAVGTAARFDQPYGVVVDANGQLVVTDFGNNRIRAVSLDGVVRTVAGVGTAGFTDGPMAAAEFNHPQGIAIDDAGDIFVTDIDNFRIRRLSGDTVVTVAGDGTAGFADNDDPLLAQFFGLEGLSVTPDGTMLFVADGGRGEAVPFNRVRSVKLN